MILESNHMLESEERKEVVIQPLEGIPELHKHEANEQWEPSMTKWLKTCDEVDEGTKFLEQDHGLCQKPAGIPTLVPSQIRTYRSNVPIE